VVAHGRLMVRGQPYCWVRGKPYVLSVVFRMLMFYAIMWPVFLYSVFVYGSIIIYIRRVAATTVGAAAEGTKRLNSTVGRLACFPAILMISILFASTNRFYQIIYERNPPRRAADAGKSYAHRLRSRAIAILVVRVIHDVCGGVVQQGVMNIIAYGFNPQVQRELRKVRRPVLSLIVGQTGGNELYRSAPRAVPFSKSFSLSKCPSQVFCGVTRQKSSVSGYSLSVQQLDLDRHRSHGVSMACIADDDQVNPVVVEA
jgi:hypothetical protein